MNNPTPFMCFCGCATYFEALSNWRRLEDGLQVCNKSALAKKRAATGPQKKGKAKKPKAKQPKAKRAAAAAVGFGGASEAALSSAASDGASECMCDWNQRQ